MLTAVATAKKLDWSGWLVGIMGAFISGGAGAIAGMAGPMIVDPKDWNLGSGLHNLLVSMAIGFILSGVVSLAKFLQTRPVPQTENEPSNS